MALSEKELLLLDCFMYADVSAKSKSMGMEELLSRYMGSDGKISATKLKSKGVKLSGDMAPDHYDRMADVMNQILNDKKLKSLTIVDTVNSKGGIRGACFVDENGEATVAFRGTGGSYKQWYDNFEGYGEVSTPAQRQAAEFIEQLPYSNITVTGHSKGGNLAMYVSIVHEDKIASCVSYEGQGFSKEFCEKYREEIERSKRERKIKSISAKNDPVHSLMIPIASSERFVKSNNNLILFSHGSYGLLKENSFDENGIFSNDSFGMEIIGLQGGGILTEVLAQFSEIPFLGTGLELITDLLGTAVALFFDPKDWKTAWKSVVKAWHEFKVNLKNEVNQLVMQLIKTVNKVRNSLKKLSYSYRYATENPVIRVDTYKLDNYAQRLDRVNRRLSDLDRRLDSLYWKVGLKDLWSLMQADLLTGYSGRIRSFASYLRETADDFEKLEKNLVKKL